jgi:hypothetical protein
VVDDRAGQMLHSENRVMSASATEELMLNSVDWEISNNDMAG